MKVKQKTDFVMRKRIIKRSANLSALVLKTALDLGVITFESFFPRQYPQARIWRQFMKMDGPKYSKQTLYNALWRLQKQGLMVRTENKWKPTLLGKKFAEKINKSIDLPKKDGVARLVLFDIPERERKKRAWLRAELINFGFQCLQKSVWIGFAPLPEKFIEDLDFLNLRQYIHILSIKQLGTIKY